MGGLDTAIDSTHEAERIARSGKAVPGPKGIESFQLPGHWVQLGSFYMDTTEVTESEWKKYMGAPPDTAFGDAYPISRANWIQAILFCNKKSLQFGLDTVYRYTGFRINIVTDPSTREEYPDTTDIHLQVDMTANGFRLPTEAEWEYTARAGTSTRFPWGSIEDTTHGWWKTPQGTGSIHPVALKRPNQWGFYDMLGNAPEWVNDGYLNSDQSSYYEHSPVGNPMGPEDGRSRFSEVLSGLQPAPGVYEANLAYKVYRGAIRKGPDVILVTPRYRAWIDPGQNIAGFRTVLQVR